MNTRHIDTDSNIPYIVTKIRRHGQRIAVDRKILGTSPLTSLSLDSINALDALLFSLQSDPHLSVPTIFDELKAIFKPTFTHPVGDHNTSFAHPVGGHNTSSAHPTKGKNICDIQRSDQHQSPTCKRTKRQSNIDREIDRENRRRSARIASLQTHYTYFIRLDHALESHSTSFSLSDIKLPKSFEAAMRTPQSNE